jgi:hypothetical protein
VCTLYGPHKGRGGEGRGGEEPNVPHARKIFGHFSVFFFFETKRLKE